jgi:hypothetical protein
MRTLAMPMIKTVLLMLLFIFNPITTNAEDPPKIDSKIYKYTGKDGVSVFTNNINSVPESLRKQVEVLEVKPEAKVTKTKSIVYAGLDNTFIRNILIAIGVILLFWLIKLWIKNMILKFIARIAIKVAIVGLVYMLAHQWFFSSEKVSFFKTVQKTVAPYKDIVPIQKVTEGIKAFNKKETEKKDILDAIP